MNRYKRSIAGGIVGDDEGSGLQLADGLKPCTAHYQPWKRHDTPQTTNLANQAYGIHLWNLFKHHTRVELLI